LITSITFRPKETSLEKIARQALEELGIKFKSKFWINIKGYSPKEYDFYIPSLNLLLEIDGEYWHSLPKNVKNDKYKDELAKIAGYKLLRIPEKLVLVDLIKKSIKKEEVNGNDNSGPELLPTMQQNT
jgi:very-short-patch-repair endonuclease